VKRLPRAAFSPELVRQMKALSDYRVFYGEVPLPVFTRAFFRVWEILDGKLDAISFDYWFRRELGSEGFL